MKKSIENSFEMVYFYYTHIRIVIEKHTLRVIRIEQGFLRNIIGDKKIKKNILAMTKLFIILTSIAYFTICCKTQ